MVKSRAIRRRRPGRARGILRSAANTALGLYNAYRSVGSRTATTSGTRAREMAPLTNDKDIRVVYIKKRMPKRRKRRYVKSLKRFRSNLLKSEPSRIHMLTWIEKPSALADTSRYFGCFMGMLANNTYDTSIQNLWQNLESTATAKTRHATLRLDHMSLNVIVRNTTSAGTTGGILDLDVYKVVFTRDVPLARWADGTQIESFMAALKAEMRQHQGMDIEVNDAGAGITTVQTNAGTSATNQAVGDILFNNPPFCRYIRVVKVWKVQLGAGQTATFNWRDSKNRAVARPECIASEAGALAAKKYLTKGYIFNINGRYGTSSFEPCSCTVEQFVRYNFKPVSPLNSDTLVYDGV